MPASNAEAHELAVAVKYLARAIKALAAGDTKLAAACADKANEECPSVYGYFSRDLASFIAAHDESK